MVMVNISSRTHIQSKPPGPGGQAQALHLPPPSSLFAAWMTRPKVRREHREQSLIGLRLKSIMHTLPSARSGKRVHRAMRSAEKKEDAVASYCHHYLK